MKRILLIALLCGAVAASAAPKTASVALHPDRSRTTINKNIYGQFAEHLGTLIYGGIWVGEDSTIPNQNGYRTDVLEAMKKLSIPVLRWPGGCFADEYHWMDGIGPRENRPKMVNTNWGGVVEDNSFGTHEFLNFCELIGAEPYLSMNVGSGTVEEMAKWVEYVNSDGDSPMANLRRANGRDKPWKVKYIGVGNESWGCGGNMRPEFYSDQFRRYQTYCRNYGTPLYKVASGASDYDYNWTEVLMDRVGNQMNGLSLHYYTVTGWSGSKGSATNFDMDSYYWILGKAVEIEEVIQKHIAIMDKADPRKRIGLMVDEWGTWYDVEPGTPAGFLHQQNTLRDAMVAALSFNIFHKYADRIQMCNIAQVVNVLQAMILTDGDKMLLTPTYHVFEMYKPFQNARHIPLDLTSDEKTIRERQVQTLSATAATGTDGNVYVALTNIDADNAQQVSVDLGGISAKTISGRILTSARVNDHNTFDKPETVRPVEFKDAKLKNGVLTVDMPAKSIVVLTLAK
ncbi:MAG: alpha-N-arabinofuranosidase [Bacteroidales bacterium]|nr:alpha-N-arabinofuranosidase [Bacteroidales bacterium]MCR5713866.1 alpha-N-arabinofuranosidase [Bacteroidales bacterium]